jgi:hypothetical protein
VLFLVAADFMLYWLHRMFHGGGFWKYHAIHHSSEDLDWISAARFHPVNLLLGAIGVDVVLLMAGISPNIMLWVGPFTTFHSAFVHANLNWTLGPFKYVLATPVFHRWHHTSLEEGGNTNFAGTFPLWDILFGTFRMPERHRAAGRQLRRRRSIGDSGLVPRSAGNWPIRFGFAFDALWNAEGPQRRSLALRWLAFGICALAASCATPYGWESILASRKILELGELLRLIYEWMPADFSRFSLFEACVFALIAGALYRGVKLSPPRIVLVLILFHMALSHVRNTEIFALLMPLVVLSPLSSQFGLHGARFVKMSFPFASAAALVAIVGISTWAFAANHKFSPTPIQSPAAAVDVLKDRNARRVLNDLPFAGYLISRKVPVFIDGRAELYGESFEMAYYRALELKDVNLFLDILKSYEIDAVLLTPSTPAAGLLDHLDGWQRVYSDETAVLHIRTAIR